MYATKTKIKQVKKVNKKPKFTLLVNENPAPRKVPDMGCKRAYQIFNEGF